MPEESEFVWSRDPTSGPWKPGDAVEVDATNGRVSALVKGEAPCPDEPRRGLVERMLDADGRVAVIWDDGERGEIHAHCLRRTLNR